MKQPWLVRILDRLRKPSDRALHPTSPAGADKAEILNHTFRMQVERLMTGRAGPEIFFIQIGAFDGVSNDPLHAYIVAHGWRGVLVEPQAGPFEQLQANYRGCEGLAFVNAAIGEADGVTDFYVVREAGNLPPWSQKIASLKKDNVLKHREGLPEYGVRVGIGDIEERTEAVQVEVWTFATLVARCGVDRIDLLQVDAEGYDARILAQVDFERFRPAIVRYEHMHLSPAEQEATLGRLRSYGYLIVAGFTETLAYLK